MSTIVSTYSPISTQAQISILVTVFPLFSAANGYLAARMYKFFNGTNWLILSFFTSTGLPFFLATSLTVIYFCEYI